MILDHLSHAAAYHPLNPRLAKGFEFLRGTDFTKDFPKERRAIDGEDVYAMFVDMRTSPLTDQKWEAHRKYADVHYIVSGEERIAVQPIESLKEVEAYNDEKDYLLLRGPGGHVDLRQGMFALLAPHDAHIPGLAISTSVPIRKVVLKVRW